MKSITSRVANSVMGWTLRPVETRPECRERGGVPGRGVVASTVSIVSSPSGVRGGAPENLDFGAFWDRRNHVRIVSQLLNLEGKK